MDMEEEIWKDVPGFEGTYRVSNFGNIKTLDRVCINGENGFYKRKGSFKKLIINNRGYYHVSMWDFKKKKNINNRVHVLVAMAFLNHTPCGMKYIIDHIDNNKLNNRVDNLQITNQRYNASKDKKNKTSKYTGVSFDRSRNKWKSVIFKDDKLKHIGRYKCEFSAHVAYTRELNKINNERVY
jgi:hypothetical protein